MAPKLSESELAIMRYIWSQQQPVTAAQVVAAFQQKKGWKIQTVSTFLGRLSEKGILSLTKTGKLNSYTPTLSEAGYQAAETRAFLNEMHHGSVKSFFAALYDSSSISPEDLQELKEWLERK